MSKEWNGSQVMGEFAKIAVESGLITSDFGNPVMGNTDKETPVKDHRRYEPGKEYGVTKGSGEDLVGKAHPKDAKPAEAMGEGGLVENIVQQQEKDIEVAMRMPSGALVGKHAALVDALVSLANDLEGEGKAGIAARVDRTIERISGLPFDSGLRKEAVGPFLALLIPVVKTLVWGGLGAGAWYAFGTRMTSVRENLSEDVRDLVETASSVGEEPSLSVLAKNLRAMLAPHASRLRRPFPPPEHKDELLKYIGDLDAFAEDLGRVSSIVGAMTAVPDAWYKLGFGAKSRLREKLSDVEKTLKDTRIAAEAAVKAFAERSVGPVPAPEAGKAETAGSNVAEIQALLAERGMKVPRSGRLDNATVEAIRRLEGQLDAELRTDARIADILEQHGWGVRGLLLRPDGTTADPQVMRRLFSLADKASGKALQ